MLNLQSTTTMKYLTKTVKTQSALMGLIFLTVIASFANENFFTVLNISNMFRQASMIGIVAIGMTFVILIGGIDLSVGANVALTAMIATLCSGLPIPLILIIPILVGGGIGLVNGMMITRFKVQPFIATLSVMLLARGLAFVISDGESVKGSFPKAIKGLARMKIMNMPAYGIIFIVVLCLCIVVLQYTSFGKKIYAVGGNEEAAGMMGINVNFIQVAAYIICGALAGLGGVLISLRMGSALAYTAQGWELTAIASVVIGGTKLSGGEGRVYGTFTGVMILQIIANSINLQGSLEYWYVWFVTGLLLLMVILFQKRVEQ